MASDESAAVSLEEYARVQTALRGAPRDGHASILEQHGFDQERWRRADEHWRLAIERDAKQGDGELLLRWADAKEAAMLAEPVAIREREEADERPVLSAPPVVQAIPTFLRADAVKPAAAWPVLGAGSVVSQPQAMRGSTREVDTTQLVGEALPFTPAKPGEAPLPIPIHTSMGPSALRGSSSLPRAELPNGQATTLPIGYVLRPDAGHTETLEGYASVFAQVAVAPKEALAICVKHGIPDDAAWKALQRRWTARLSADPELYRTWFKLYTQYRATFERK